MQIKTVYNIMIVIAIKGYLYSFVVYSHGHEKKNVFLQISVKTYFNYGLSWKLAECFSHRKKLYYYQFGYFLVFKLLYIHLIQH